VIIRILTAAMVELCEYGFSGPIPRVGEYVVTKGKQYTVLSVTYRLDPDPAVIVMCGEGVP
jgi:hypothetical protein